MDLFDVLGFTVPLLGVIYFFPGFLASAHHHPRTRAIFALTALFGWTFIGWAAAVLWAMTTPGERKVTAL